LLGVLPDFIEGFCFDLFLDQRAVGGLTCGRCGG
jgi:hypothetical protein